MQRCLDLAKNGLGFTYPNPLVGSVVVYNDKIGLENTIESVIRQNPLKKNLNAVEIVNRLDTAFDEILLTKMLSELCSEGRLVKIDGGFQFQNLKGKFTEQQEHLLALLFEYAQKSGVVPFSADTIWKLHDKKYESGFKD